MANMSRGANHEHVVSILPDASFTHIQHTTVLLLSMHSLSNMDLRLPVTTEVMPHYIAQTGLPPAFIPLASASRMLWLQIGTTTVFFL